MLFRQLEYFVALARERHFARAAGACHVSQPALSEAIRKLEHELDVPLVRRGHRFEGLTPEGERLVRWARRILADHDLLRQEVAALQHGLTGELRLGAVPAASSTAVRITDPLCMEHPLVRVRLTTRRGSAELVEMVRRRELDGAVVYATGPDVDGMRTTVLYRERHVPVAGSELLAGRPGPWSWGDVLELPLCLLEDGMHGRELVDTALAGHGLAPAPRLETDSLVALAAHVATGNWASVLPEAWARSSSWPAAVSVVPMQEPPIVAPVALVTPADEPGSLLLRALTAVAGRVGAADSADDRRSAPVIDR